jgi:hypothetical protein
VRVGAKGEAPHALGREVTDQVFVDIAVDKTKD